MEKIEKVKILSKDEIVRIHENSLRVLQNTGVFVYSDEVLRICSDHGLNTDVTGRIVKFPERIIEKCLSTVPGGIKIYNRKGSVCAELGKGDSYTASGHNVDDGLKI